RHQRRVNRYSLTVRSGGPWDRRNPCPRSGRRLGAALRQGWPKPRRRSALATKLSRGGGGWSLDCLAARSIRPAERLREWHTPPRAPGERTPLVLRGRLQHQARGVALASPAAACAAARRPGGRNTVRVTCTAIPARVSAHTANAIHSSALPIAPTIGSRSAWPR